VTRKVVLGERLLVKTNLGDRNGTPLNKDRNSESKLIWSNKSVKPVLTVALLLKMKRIWRFAQNAAQEEEDLNILATFSTNGIIYVVNLYTIHLQSNCSDLSGVFKTLLNNSKTWRNFRYANMFSTGFPPHMLQNLISIFFQNLLWWFQACGVGKSVMMIKCVCVTHSQ